jgi:hypothetical protein
LLTILYCLVNVIRLLILMELLDLFSFRSFYLSSLDKELFSNLAIIFFTFLVSKHYNQSSTLFATLMLYVSCFIFQKEHTHTHTQLLFINVMLLFLLLYFLSQFFKIKILVKVVAFPLLTYINDNLSYKHGNFSPKHLI